MAINILFFAMLRESTGVESVQIDADVPMRAGEFFEKLTKTYPALERYRPIISFAVNGEYGSKDTIIHDGDEVALIPPIAGG